MNLIRETLDHIPEGGKILVDVASLSVAAATVVNALPQIAAALSILWTLVRLSESRRVIQLVQGVGRIFLAIAENPRLLALIQWVSSTRVATAIGDAIVRIFRRAPAAQQNDETRN